MTPKTPQTKPLPKCIRAHFGHLPWTWDSCFSAGWAKEFSRGIWEVKSQQGYDWFQVLYFADAWVIGSSRAGVQIEVRHKSLAKCRDLYLSKVLGVSDE
jgi:hypothetical protein